MPSVPENDWTDEDFKKIVQATQEACQRPLTPEGTESFAYHPEPHSEAYNPSPDDLAEMARWSQSVQDHDDALTVWMDFFGESEERSTYYVS